jgi:pimeloyl-ACP methyl ester carboxylesterase
MTEPETHALDAPGAVLHYDVRRNDVSTEPTLLLIGSPMGAEGFGTLAGHFTDRTVVTYDPRGAGRSKRTDGASQTSVEEQADDLHRLIDALGAGPVDIFATSGGAVNALALVASHPAQVRILVAHEPPAAQELPDREQALAAFDAIKETYLRAGFGPAMAKFIALVSYQGPIPAGFADQAGPDPATLGLPTVDDGTRDDALLCLNMPSCPGYRHDFAPGDQGDQGHPHPGLVLHRGLHGVPALRRVRPPIRPQRGHRRGSGCGRDRTSPGAAAEPTRRGGHHRAVGARWHRRDRDGHLTSPG